MTEARVHGLKMYYEVHGNWRSGVPPLVLLHGGGDTIQTSFEKIMMPLAEHRQVIAFERQGYGRTADIEDRPYSFEQFAADTAGLLEHLHVPKADLFGFSNGGTVALHVAIRHRSFVRKLVLASALYRRDGMDAAFWEGFATATPDAMPKVLRDAYLESSPHPENFERFFYKSVKLMQGFENIPRGSLQSLSTPALVICGDRDVVRVEHAIEQFRLIPGSQLAILPDTDHMNVTSRTEWLVPMIEKFLDS